LNTQVCAAFGRSPFSLRLEEALNVVELLVMVETPIQVLPFSEDLAAHQCFQRGGHIEGEFITSDGAPF
jgi:hypothetical protein